MLIFPSSILSSHSAEQSHKRDLKFYRELEKTGSGAQKVKISEKVHKPPLGLADARVKEGTHV